MYIILWREYRRDPKRVLRRSKWRIVNLWREVLRGFPSELEDWSGYPAKMPKLHKAYIWSHSLVPAFCVGVIEIFVLYGFPCLSIGWTIHVVYDIPSHSGEFEIKPFHPSKWSYGYEDAWAWPISKMAKWWGYHALAIIALYIANTVVR